MPHYDGTTDISSGWHHLAYVRTINGHKVYLDGVEEINVDNYDLGGLSPLFLSAEADVAPSSLSWTFRTSLSGFGIGDTFWSAALGLFVGSQNVSPSHVFYTSPDGIAWTAYGTTGVRTPARMTFNETLGLFVAIGIGDFSNQTVCWSSTDGSTWTRTVDFNSMSTRMLATSEDLGIFICGGVGAAIYHSTDGHTWTFGTQISPFSLNVDDAVWSHSLGIFCAIIDDSSSDYVTATSTDGINWTSHIWSGHGRVSGYTWSRIDWSESLGLFCMVGNQGTHKAIVTSPDGVNWTLRTMPGASGYTAVKWLPGVLGTGAFVVAGAGPLAYSSSLDLIVDTSFSGSICAYSQDGITWTAGDALPTTTGVSTGILSGGSTKLTAMKIWQASLTDVEILAEMDDNVAVRTDNLYLETHLDPTVGGATLLADLVDSSPGAHDWKFDTVAPGVLVNDTTDGPNVSGAMLHSIKNDGIAGVAATVIDSDLPDGIRFLTVMGWFKSLGMRYFRISNDDYVGGTAEVTLGSSGSVLRLILMSGVATSPSLSLAASPTQPVGPIPSTVTLTAMPVYDDTFVPDTYAWTLVDSPDGADVTIVSPSAAVTDVVFNAAIVGSYTFQANLIGHSVFDSLTVITVGQQIILKIPKPVAPTVTSGRLTTSY